MIHIHVPKNFRGDALLTACYLVNRVQSSILYGLTLFSTLYKDENLFDLTPREFDCLCFVHIIGTEHDKLDPRSERSVF